MNKPSEQILQKLNEINSAFNAKSNKYYSASTQSLENKLEMIKKKLAIAVIKNKEETNSIIQDANVLLSKVEKSNQQHERETKNQLQRLRVIQNNFTKKLEVEILQRKERENQIIRSFQEKAAALKKQIEKQRKAREALFAQVTSTLEQDLPAIMSQMNDAKTHFEAEEDEIVTNCEGLIQQTEQYVKQFAIEQQTNSQKAFQLIKDLTKKIKTEIQQQKIACEATHEQLFGYVEETCSKLTE